MEIENINTLLSSELLDNEEILWTGKPNYKKLFEKSDIFLVPFSIIWLLIAIIFELIALIGTKEGGIIDMIFPIVGGMFILVGLYYSFGRFIYKYNKKKKTYYVVTNDRILTIRKGKKRIISTKFIKDISEISKVNDKREMGTIVFDQNSHKKALFFDTGIELFSSNKTEITIVFHDIEKVNNVYQIIMEIKKGISS